MWLLKLGFPFLLKSMICSVTGVVFVGSLDWKEYLLKCKMLVVEWYAQYGGDFSRFLTDFTTYFWVSWSIPRKPASIKIYITVMKRKPKLGRSFVTTSCSQTLVIHEELVILHLAGWWFYIQCHSLRYFFSAFCALSPSSPPPPPLLTFQHSPTLLTVWLI